MLLSPPPATRDSYFVQEFDNGLIVVAQHMPGVRSLAMNVMLHAGGATDPLQRSGSATVLAEMMLRGAGKRDARQLSEHLDDLGLVRSSGVGLTRTRFSAAGLASSVMTGLSAYADIVRRPRLGPEAFEPSRDLALQALASLEDSPQARVMVKLAEWHWPIPLGRNAMGEAGHLRKLTLDAVRDDFSKRFGPPRAVLALAGELDFPAVIEGVKASFDDWEGPEHGDTETGPPAGQFRFIEQDSQQTHIGLAFPSVAETHEDYYLARLAVEVLSGGMSGRLFSEIREKRGLCYSVSAGYKTVPGFGAVFCYAGTSNERAQETLDALISEIQRLREGVTAEELDRARIGLKAATVMSGESSSARSGAIAHDWITRGRLRTLDEILTAIDEVTVEDLNRYVADHPAGRFTVVLIGPSALTVPAEQRNLGGAVNAEPEQSRIQPF